VDVPTSAIFSHSLKKSRAPRKLQSKLEKMTEIIVTDLDTLATHRVRNQEIKKIIKMLIEVRKIENRPNPSCNLKSIIFADGLL
jgi:hypothetical protein